MNVCFDIETTGFTVQDEITVAGFYPLDGTPTLFVNAPEGIEVMDVESSLSDLLGEYVVVENSESTAGLLEETQKWVDLHMERDDVLVAYNGETWRGGFDIPFIRSASRIHDAPYPFEGVKYLELMEIVQKRWNTTVYDRSAGALRRKGQVKSFAEFLGIDDFSGSRDEWNEHVDDHEPSVEEWEAWLAEEGIDLPTTDIGDLDGVYEIFGEDIDWDPYEESVEAVEAWQGGDYESVLKHNLADIARTAEILEMVFDRTPGKYKSTVTL